MADIRSILALEPRRYELCGCPCLLKRPSLADLIDAVAINERGPAYAKAWALHRHLLDERGDPLFATVDDAMKAPAGMASKAIAAIEDLYSEGAD